MLSLIGMQHRQSSVFISDCQLQPPSSGFAAVNVISWQLRRTCARRRPLRLQARCDHCSRNRGRRTPRRINITTAGKIAAAYQTQAVSIEAAGRQLILMASRAFPNMRAGRVVYRSVYRQLSDGGREMISFIGLATCLIQRWKLDRGSEDVAI